MKLLAKQGQLQIYLDMKGRQLLCNCKMPHTTKENKDYTIHAIFNNKKMSYGQMEDIVQPLIQTECSNTHSSVFEPF